MLNHGRARDSSRSYLIALLIALLLLNMTPLLSAQTPEVGYVHERITPSQRLLDRVDTDSQMPIERDVLPWYLSTSMDMNRDRVFDTFEDDLATYDASLDLSFFIDFSSGPTDDDLQALQALGIAPGAVLDSIHTVGVRTSVSKIQQILALPGVVMIEPQGDIIWYSDVATPAVKVKQSEFYSPVAWDLDIFGAGSNIAVVDTGIDNEHESLQGKFVSGVDMTKPDTIFTPRDGTYDPNDVQGHGSTCAGIATGTGGPEQLYQGVGIEASLVDVRIGTKIGYGIGELLPQEFYDSHLLRTRASTYFHCPGASMLEVTPMAPMHIPGSSIGPSRPVS